MTAKFRRMVKSLARNGLILEKQKRTYTVRLKDDPHATDGTILLPEGFPLEEKALLQLANLAAAWHPDSGSVERVVAMPDFHPGDTGIAIGSVIKTRGMMIPAAVGSDINCGMRLHATDMDLDEFLAQKAKFVEFLKGDYLLGSRNLPVHRSDFRALFTDGMLGFIEAMGHNPIGILKQVDFDALMEELNRVAFLGSLPGDLKHVPPGHIEGGGTLRDDGLGTIGRGNHFVEVQVVDEILDGSLAYQWGIKKGHVTFMIHSGSRKVGKSIGQIFQKKTVEAWPGKHPYPDTGMFTLSLDGNRPLIEEYLAAQNAAVNYGFLNRALLAELFRHRMRQVYGDVSSPLVYDVPHNIMIPGDDDTFVTRKGACIAEEGKPVIIPGSMGTYSYVLVGTGNDDFLCSASHGAGRAKSRFSLSRKGATATESELGLDGVECITLRPERRIE